VSSKEKAEYTESIVQDLARLGVQPDYLSHTSDHFAIIEVERFEPH
jgi:glutamyl/glutaminyl-tRNA synthetase